MLSQVVTKLLHTDSQEKVA